MSHYVCTGTCGNVSETAGACNAQNCSRFQKPFLACHCGDGNHNEAYENQSDDED